LELGHLDTCGLHTITVCYVDKVNLCHFVLLFLLRPKNARCVREDLLKQKATLYALIGESGFATDAVQRGTRILLNHGGAFRGLLGAGAVITGIVICPSLCTKPASATQIGGPRLHWRLDPRSDQDPARMH
jgi:hypothetical protein